MLGGLNHSALDSASGKSDNLPVPKRSAMKPAKLTILIDPTLKHVLRVAAANRGLSASELARVAIAAYLKPRKPGRKGK
jgi:hypothetical protein